MARLRQNFVSLFGGSLVAHQTFDVDFLGFESHISNNDPGALHGLYCKISVLRRRHLASKYFKINVYQSFTLHDVFKLVLTSCSEQSFKVLNFCPRKPELAICYGSSPSKRLQFRHRNPGYEVAVIRCTRICHCFSFFVIGVLEKSISEALVEGTLTTK